MKLTKVYAVSELQKEQGFEASDALPQTHLYTPLPEVAQLYLPFCRDSPDASQQGSTTKPGSYGLICFIYLSKDLSPWDKCEHEVQSYRIDQDK